MHARHAMDQERSLSWQETQHTVLEDSINHMNPINIRTLELANSAMEKEQLLVLILIKQFFVRYLMTWYDCITLALHLDQAKQQRRVTGVKIIDGFDVPI